MTLHEAITKLLLENKRSMSTNEIANLLNKRKLYVKKDNSLITSFQIHGRTRNYPSLFNRDGNMVGLKSIGEISPNETKFRKNKIISKAKYSDSFNIMDLEEFLFNNENYHDANAIDGIIPDTPGIYCIRIKNIDSLPPPFNVHLFKRKHNIIYIGIATESLHTRLLNQELRAKGHGTFFRSLGAILGFLPIRGALKNKSNKRNYKFSKEIETQIINWINNNLVVNWIEFADNSEKLETILIKKYLPLINLAKNPATLYEISKLRAKCVEFANS